MKAQPINEVDIDYSKLILLKELEQKDMLRIRHYTYLADDDPRKIQRVKTPKGVAVYKEEVENLFKGDYDKRGRNSTKMGYAIDLSTPSRMNCLYRRMASMNQRNRQYCEAGTIKCKRYVAQDGWMYINLKDFCKPQIKQLAKKLECKEHEIVACLFDLLHKQYLKNKGEFADDTERISDET